MGYHSGTPDSASLAAQQAAGQTDLVTPAARAAAEALAAITTGAIPVKTSGGYADSVYTNAGATLPAATAAGTGWSLTGAFAPTSGSDAYALHAINLTVNQTGGANGTVTALKINITETAAVGADYICDYQIGGVSKWSIRGSAPIASATGAMWDSYRASGFTQLIKGNTRIETAAGFNKIAFYAPTLISDTATLTIDRAATVYISGPPIAGANATITAAYALWVDSGNARFDGNITTARVYNSQGFAPTDVAYGTGAGVGMYFAGSGVGFATASNTRLFITSDGNVVLGGESAGTSAAKCLALTNGATAPSASADLVHLYGADHGGVAASSALAVWQEVATVTAGDNTADRYVPATVNGAAVWLLARSSAPS